MRRGVHEHRFSNTPEINYPRSTFDRSHTHKTTFDSSYLIPVLVEEILPGDSVNINQSFFCRMASPPVYPLMDNIYLEHFAFFVPNRLVWANWQKFMGEQEDPGDSIAYTIPVITLDTDMTAYHGYLYDYLGIPLIDYNTSNYTMNVLPRRGYYRIWNEWFRDQNLQKTNEYGTATGDGPDADYGVTANSYEGRELMYRGKRHDYFTSCLPWLQKGTAVSLPLGTVAPVMHDFSEGYSSIFADDNHAYKPDSTSSGQLDVTDLGLQSADFDSQMYADLDNATAATVNELRLAFQTQRLLEKDARAGTRYIEIVHSHFGVTSPDARHQRPEFLGSSSTMLNVNPVPKTDFVNATPTGAEVSAFVTGYGNFQFVKSFTEHGYLFVIANVRADLTYQEGFDRHWQRSTRYDFYTPVLAHLGEQAVLNREIFIDDGTITASSDDSVFGYQERWAEYRYKKSQLTGSFRGNHATSLEDYHLSDQFGSEPSLNDAFIKDSAKTEVDRVAVSGTPQHWLYDSWFNMKHTRVMPVYSVPGKIDHF